ncbi:MAG: DNA polymerase [Bryocella sp.]
MTSAEINWIFVDLNSYFASVEQELQPLLRGRPIVVVPVDADTTCVIAASYQAKIYGIKTGTAVHDAKLLCPHLILVEARPRLYVEFHHRLIEAIERCVPVQQVMSCDEFACQLMGRERTLLRSIEIAYAIKQEMRKVGLTLRCSIGLAPNRLLAKIAGEMQKPDGLMVLLRQNLPHSLYSLAVSDIPGIGTRMEERLRTAGITTMKQLCSLPRDRMSSLWGNVWGERLWHWLRGEDFLEPAPKPLQTLSRQHVLSPTCRTPDRARGVALKLLHSTARKMRRHNLWAGGVFLRVGYFDHPAFDAVIRIVPCQDTYTLQEHVLQLWQRAPCFVPADIAVGLSHLDTEPAPDLFAIPEPDARSRVVTALDAMNARYGLNTVYLGSIHSVRNEAPTRVPFGAPPPLEEFDDPADIVRKPPSRYSLTQEQSRRIEERRRAGKG